MPTLLHPDDHAFHRMVAAFEGEPEPWFRVNRALRDALVTCAAERSPYYRSVIRPGMAFEDIPILTKDVVRDRYDDLVAEGVHRDRWAADATSGSLGPAASFLRDTAQGLLENVSGLRFLKWMEGIPPDATRVWISSGHPERRRRSPRRGRGGEDHPLRIQDLTPESLARESRVWARFPSYFIYGHASIIGWIAEQVDRGNVELRRRPVAIVTTADTLTDHGAQQVSRILGAPVHSWYGGREVNGYVAGTLPGTRRYAFNPLLVYPEVVDGVGRPVRPGDIGRLVLTDLNNLVMPFVRYDMGDVAIPSAVGSVGGFPLIDHLVGRDIELIRFPSGRVLNGVTLGRVLFVEHDLGEDILWYQCAKTRENAVELRVVWAPSAGQDSSAAAARAVRTLADPDTDVRVRTVNELERLPSGKVWILRDESSPR